MPEATTFFMSRDPADSLELYGFKRPHTWGEQGQLDGRAAEWPCEPVSFNETSGLSPSKADCVRKMGESKPGGAGMFNPKQRTLGYGELRALGFDMLHRVSSKHMLLARASTAKIRFLDLGSGLGPVVAYAAILAGWQAKGIEMCPKMHKAAVQWFTTGLIPSFPTLAMAGALRDTGQSLCGDMRAADFEPHIHEADVIFMNNLLFDDVATGAAHGTPLHSTPTPLTSTPHHSTPLHSTALHSTALLPHCTPLHCTALHSTPTPLHSTPTLHCTAAPLELHCTPTPLHSTALHSTPLHPDSTPLHSHTQLHCTPT